MNAEVFQMLEYQPLLLHEATHQRMIKRLPKHKWAFPNWGRIPSAYILPKRKKDFATGRPIVSFVQAQGRALWESFADVLSLMTRQACPDSFGEGSGVNQLQLIKQHLRHLSETTTQEPMMREDVTRMNQDLAGFFTSIRFIPLDAALVPATQHSACNNLHSGTLGVFAGSPSPPRITQTYLTHHHHTATPTQPPHPRVPGHHLCDPRVKLLHGGRQSGPTGQGCANGIPSIPSPMLYGRGCPRTSVGHHIQKLSV